MNHAMTLTGEPLPDWLKDLVIRHDDGREVPIIGLYVQEGETIEAALLRDCPAGCSIVRRTVEPVVHEEVGGFLQIAPGRWEQVAEDYKDDADVVRLYTRSSVRSDNAGEGGGP